MTPCAVVQQGFSTQNKVVIIYGGIIESLELMSCGDFSNEVCYGTGSSTFMIASQGEIRDQEIEREEEEEKRWKRGEFSFKICLLTIAFDAI